MASRQWRLDGRKLEMELRSSRKISQEEESYRLNHYPDSSSISTYRLSCTKCDTVIKPRTVIESNVHPILKVLLCRKCRHFYDQRLSQNGNWCTWCANEGKLFGCGTCSAKFCENCINKNFRLARIIFQEISECKWKCGICFSKPIWSQRAVCAAAKTYADDANNALKERIAKCQAVKKRSGTETVSTLNQSTASGTIIKSSSTSGLSHQRSSSVPSLTSTLKPEEKLKFGAMKDPTVTVGEGKNSLEQCKNESKDCVICLLNPRIMALYPCGHKCLCEQCSALLSAREKVCPLCRKEFRDIFRVYD